jgi:hypothetical protein
MKETVLLTPIFLVAVATFSWGQGQVTYKKDIRPLIQEKCMRCHGSSSPPWEEFKKDQEKFTKENIGPRMDLYPLLLGFVKGKDAGALMRRLDDGANKEDGKPGNMHIYLGRDEGERQKNLKIFKDWVGSWNLKRRHQLSEEELYKIKAPE